MTSYQQPPPSGPSSSSTSTRNSKLDQIIQNFYTKTAQIIIQARCTPGKDARYGNRSSLRGSTTTKKMNKWFNIATEDTELLREDIKFWRTVAVQSPDKEPPPMILDIYLDTSALSQNQSLVVADDNLRWGCVELKSTENHIDRILVESWELTLRHPFPDHAVDLPNLYKRSIVFFRSLHSLARLLPSYDLYHKLHKTSDTSNPLSIGYRLSTSSLQKRSSEIPLDSSIIESDARKPTKNYEFNDIVTPIGTFKLNVTYRRNCDFKVEDTERDLSAQFIDMDEQFFTPTMAMYQKQQQQQQESHHLELSPNIPLSMYRNSTLDASKIDNPIKQSNTDDEFRSSPTNAPSPRHPTDPRDIHSQRSPKAPFLSGTTRLSNSPSASSTRRASAPFVVSPFKSPFLSSSPQADSIFSGAGSSGSPQRHYSSTASSDKSRPADSGSFGRKIEFSSSFDKYKASPTNRTTTDSPSSASMMRRWSRASEYSGSINIKTDHDDDDDLEDFVKLVGSNQELHLFQQQRSTIIGGGQLTSSTSDSTSSSSIMGASTSKKAALSHFQNLRETHASLSDSLTSSMMIGGSSSGQQDPVSGVSPVSSTSSTGRSYQPIVPSPLHAEQRSTSPVHIPRSYPQLRSMTNPHNALRLARLHTSHHHPPSEDGNEGEADFGRRERRNDEYAQDSDMSAYATYPQDHHQESHMFRNTIATERGTRVGTPRRMNTDSTVAASDTITAAAVAAGAAAGAAAAASASLVSAATNAAKNIDEDDEDEEDDTPSRRTTTTAAATGSARRTAQSVRLHTNSSDSSLMLQEPSGGRGNTSSLIDDDDSLVFKMSEIECEGPSAVAPTDPTSPHRQQQQQHEISFNNRYNSNSHNLHCINHNSNTSSSATSPTRNRTNEPFLELTPTPLSPPLLHRLQAISMSTVAEEEERNNNSSASGSSNRSDTNHGHINNITKPSLLPFDRW